MTRPRITVLGATTGPRAHAFRAALVRLGVSDARHVGYDRFAEEPGALEAVLEAGTVLRFDSPDRERASLAALYRAGADSAEAAGYPVLEAATLDGVLDRRGALGSPAQLAFGLHRVLSRATRLARKRGARLLATAEDVATTFDKSACADRLEAAGITVPRRLGGIASYDDLIERMRAARLLRVFVKLRYGSSAAGMTALALGPRGQVAAYTTALIAEDGLLCASRSVRRLTDHSELRPLIDRLAPLGLHAEAWLPKAGIDGRNADLRIITVAGKPVFCVMRLSALPMTNLHLGGERRPPDALRARVGDAVWQRLLDTCQDVARAFPDSFMLGIDAAMLAGDRRHAVLEVNAFGDHVKGVTYKGFAPQDWQILQYGTLVPA